jgi:hypothetical protein
MTNRSTSANFVTAFATGWPENQPEIPVLSLTTRKGVQDLAFNKEQALSIAKTTKATRSPAGQAESGLARQRNIGAPELTVSLDHDGLLVAGRSQ